MRLCVAAILVGWSLYPGVALAQPVPDAPSPDAGTTAPGTPATAPAAQPSPGIVFLGLRPLKSAGGAADLPKLKQAQQIRATIESAFAQSSRQPVLGHSQVSAELGASYLVAMFECAGKLSCLTKLAKPFTKEGFQTVYAGDYYVDRGTYKFHIFAYSLDTGAIEKEVNVALSSDAVQEPEPWVAALAPFFAAEVGRVQITIDVPGATCRIDGDACHFEDDGKTVTLPLGAHELTVSKDGYITEKIPITVEAGPPRPISVALRVTDTIDELRVPPALGRRAPTLPAVRTETPPQIDGKLDDLVWRKAWVDPNFTQNFPDEGKPPTQRTEMRVLYDDTAVYVAIRSFDTEPQKINARLTRRDRDIDSDKVAVSISSKNDRASAYQFQVNAAGVQVDGIRFNDTEFATEWDGRWYSATSRDKLGWIAELKIPLVTLRYNGDVSTFGFQVRRSIPRRGEIVEWSYVPRTARGEVSYYGAITGMSGLDAKRLFEVLLYDTRRFTSRRNQAFEGTTQSSDIGADFKVGITPALTLNGTINPDFGTVEVDQVILNLSTVEAYFPEKRPFFQEGSELFATPYTLFYTRRVGATPPGAILGGTSELLEPPPSGRIWGAMNMSGLLTKRTSFALLAALTARRDVTIRRAPGEAPEKLLVDPLTNFGVLRLRREFGTNSSIGLLATSVNRFEPKDEAAPQPGDLCPVPYSTAFTTLIPPTSNKGRCTNDAYTAGIDGKLRTSDGEWGASGQVAGSLIMHGPKRQVPDGSVIGSGSRGFATVLEAGRYGGEHWLYTVGYRAASPRFQINDAGFLANANFHELGGSLSWRTTKPTRAFQSASVKFDLKHRRDWKLLDNTYFSADLSTTLQLKNLWSVTVGGYPFLKYVENRETRDGARTQRNNGYFAYLDMATNRAKAAVFSLSAYTFSVFDGRQTNEASATLSLRPIPALELDLITAGGLTTDYPRSRGVTDNGDGSRTYLFNDLRYESLDVTMRGTYTFTRKLTLQAYVQTFLTSGEYSNPEEITASGVRPLLRLEDFVPSAMPARPGFRDGAVNVNLFLRWEYLPLSAIWLVFTHNQGQTGFDPMVEGEPRLRFDRFSNGPATDVLLLKLTYLWH